MPTESVKRPVIETESGSRYLFEEHDGVKRVLKEDQPSSGHSLIASIFVAIERLFRSR